MSVVNETLIGKMFVSQWVSLEFIIDVSQIRWQVVNMKTMDWLEKGIGEVVSKVTFG